MIGRLNEAKVQSVVFVRYPVLIRLQFHGTESSVANQAKS